MPSSEIGYRQFKGIPDKIKVYKVLNEDPVTAENPGETAAREPHAENPAPDKGKPEAEKETVFEAPGGMAGMILGMMGNLGLGNVDIEKNGKKVKVDKGEIHVVDKGREIHISKNGIRIRKAGKDGE